MIHTIYVSPWDGRDPRYFVDVDSHSVTVHEEWADISRNLHLAIPKSEFSAVLKALNEWAAMETALNKYGFT